MFKLLKKIIPFFIALLIALPSSGICAITEAALIGSGSTANATSYATASYTPTATKLILAHIVNSRSAGTVSTPTMTGNSLTWVQISTVTNSAATKRSTWFRAMAGSTSAGTDTIDFAGVTQNNCAWSIFELAGIDTTGTNGSGAIVQSVTGTANAVATLSITLAAFGSSGNGAVSGFVIDNNLAVTPDTGWTEIHEAQVSDGADSITNETQWRADNDTTAAASWTGNQIVAGIAIEIKAAGGAAATVPQRTLVGVGT